MTGYESKKAAARDKLMPQSAQEPVSAKDWEGAEYWMPLAWALCAEELGEDACNDLIWVGGPIPEPWGEQWLKYKDEAKRLIAIVQKNTPPQPAPTQLLAHIKFLEDELLTVIADGYYSPYTTPPQRPWVGLTYEEKSEMWEISRAALPRYATYATLIEANLKERNT